MDSLVIAKKILAESLFVPVEKISDDASINDVKELDSLSFEALLLEVEEITNREIDPIKIMQIKKVRDLADLIETLT
ncbi:acyl carrier protein [Ochrobactrum soli]|uniref:acyl carrier protein n=1 Tax=Ochrobactrum soli TaxID=2448455 RepID=UPI000EF1EE60|nr:acyl carrier protein [[Ochrobactrum] soli]RLL65459.1 acyl carrier protein [[Ochrobactrum] soli]